MKFSDKFNECKNGHKSEIEHYYNLNAVSHSPTTWIVNVKCTRCDYVTSRDATPEEVKVIEKMEETGDPLVGMTVKRGLNFAQAVQLLVDDKKVRRGGWNGDYPYLKKLENGTVMMAVHKYSLEKKEWLFVGYNAWIPQLYDYKADDWVEVIEK